MAESLEPSQPGPVPGFRSAAARKTFLIAAGILGIAVLALQVLPLRLGGLIAEPQGPRWAVRLENFHGESLARWRGDLWYVASEVRNLFEPPENTENQRLVRLSADGPTTVCSLANGPAFLLPEKEFLWILSSDGLSQYDGKEVRQVPAEKLPESASRPFLLGGQPAVVREEAGDWTLLVLADGRWAAKATAPAPATAGGFSALPVGDELHLFRQQGDLLYWRNGFPDKDMRFPSGWETVGPAEKFWTAAAVEGKPAIFEVKPQKDSLSGEIVGLRRDAAGGWKPFFSRACGLAPHALGVASEDGAFDAAYQAVQWSLNVVRAEDGKTLAAKRYGELLPGGKRSLLLLLPAAASAAVTLLFVLAISRLMAVCREDAPREAAGPARLAPVWRRAFAALLDALIVLGPLLAGMAATLAALPRVEDRPDSTAMVVATPLLLGGALWAAAGFLILCYSLGRWGRTPGKWALGVRVVGTNLQPCGFARALLRSLLLFVDGFLDFTLGVLAIAYSANWQRIGDLAARTLVLRDPGPEA